MKLKTRVLIYAITLALSLSYAHSAFAVSALTVSSSGNGGFVLRGTGMDSVAALDITIAYDTTVLANPRVVQGGLISGALMAVNPNVPGTVRMGVVTTSPIQGDGVIATLNFDLAGNSPGRIISIKASLSNSNGNQLPVQAQILNPSDESVSTSATPLNAGTQSGTTVSSGGATPDVGRQIVVGGGVMPSDNSAAIAKKETSSASETMPEPVRETPAVSQEPVSYAAGTEQSAQPVDQSKTIYAQKKVLELFRDYKGERSVKAFTALFNQTPPSGFRQDPPIVLSNGKATVKISFIATPSGNKPPFVRVEDATLLSLKSDPSSTNTWIAELRPVKKTVSAALFVSYEKVMIEFPIIVAPVAVVDLDKSGKVTEADFKLFLRDRGSEKKPKFDLNGDGKRDFVDDYIFTANYLIKKKPKK
jgi:hypothetical protein